LRTKTIRTTWLAIPAAAWCLASLLVPAAPAATQPAASATVTRPVVSEDVSPLEPIAPVARDGYRGQGFLRKPPGDGPFPAVVVIHGGLTTRPVDAVKEYALSTPNSSRFLAAGYVVEVITYRSRDDDPQSKVALEDSLAAIEHLRRMPYVDPKSIVVSGCSGGGDLALEVASATDVAAIAPEEPASILFTGIFNKESPRRERDTRQDAAPISAEPRRYFTAAYRSSRARRSAGSTVRS
jgi:dipeptidyl aminopeptidase/acylaminoacyl peptidase